MSIETTTLEGAEQLLGDYPNTTASLPKNSYEYLMAKFKEAKNFFILSWQGKATPDDISIQDKKIGSLRSFTVLSREGEFIGHYFCLEKDGSGNCRSQKVLVFTG